MKYRSVLFAVLVAGLFSGAAVTDLWACPESFDNQGLPPACVVPGKPDIKDGVMTVMEYQMNCMDSSKFPGAHAQPVADDDSCEGNGERLWECCAPSGQ